MPINQTANLLEYFNQNTPASSQAQSPPALTYPPIGAPGAISSVNFISDTFATGFTQGFTQGVPSKYIGIDASGTTMTQPLIPGNGQVNYLSDTYSVGFTTNMSQTSFTGVSGTPGSMTFSSPPGQSPLTQGNAGQTVTSTGYFQPAGTLTAFAQAQAIPINTLSPLSNLPAGGGAEVFKNISAAGDPIFRQAKTLSLIGPENIQPLKVPGETNFFDTDSKYASGFNREFTPGVPSKYSGISGQVGSMVYTKPMATYGAEVTFTSIYGPSTKYEDQSKRYSAEDFGLDTEITTERRIPLTHDIKSFTLSDIYKAGNFDSVKTKFDQDGPYITRGIQSSSPNYDKLEDINAFADIHIERLNKAIEGSTWQGGFKERRKRMQIFQLQSRFALGLGIVPHLFRGGPMNAKQDLNLKRSDLISDLASKAWIKGGTIARVPYSLTDYGLQNNLFFKYGLGSGKDQAIWDALRKLKDKVLEQPADDLIPFHFKYLHRGPAASKVHGNYLQFRGTVKTVNHSVTPQWNTQKFIGRPDSVHTYMSYDENLSFSFDLYAASRTDMLPLYKNLEALMDLCKPSWNMARTYMTGPVTELTIGNYVEDQPGFIKSLSISPNEQIYWDLGKDPMKALPQVAQAVPQGLIDSVLPRVLGGNLGRTDFKVPRAFNISLNYQFIQKDLPDANGIRRWSTNVAEDPGRWLSNWL